MPGGRGVILMTDTDNALAVATAGKGVYVTPEQYRQACAVDLGTWLLTHRPDAVKLQYGCVILLADRHVSTKRGFHGYSDFKGGKTGNNIDYLMQYLGYTYQGAVLALLGLSADDARASRQPASEAGSSSPVPVRPVASAPPAPRPVVLPDPAANNKRVYAYLTQSRGIPGEVVNALIARRLLYQSAQGSNAVFCTPQNDYCEIRGTSTYADARCRERDDCPACVIKAHGWCVWMSSKDSEYPACPSYHKDAFHGSKKASPDRFWYWQPDPSGPSTRIYVCEAVIDAISLYVIHRKASIEDAGSAVYISIGGAANQLPIDRLKEHYKDKSRIYIATDSDSAGNATRIRNAELPTIRPISKDWNQDLKGGLYYGNDS